MKIEMSSKTRERLLYLISPIALLVVWQVLLMAGIGDRTVVMTAQPGRIKRIVEVPFSRPRNLMTLSASPEFGQLKLAIWQVLEEEVTRARRDEEK